MAKVVIIGDANTGKSSLLMRFLKDRFESTSILPTVGTEFGSKTVTTDKQRITLCVWDIAGQDRFKAVAKSYYRNAQAAILVCSDRRSFNSLISWQRELRQVVEAKMVLFFNKSDLSCDVSDQEVALFCKNHQVDSWFRVSAKTGDRVQEGFEYLANKIRCEEVPKSTLVLDQPLERDTWCWFL